MSARALYFPKNGTGPHTVVKSKTTGVWFVVDTRRLQIVETWGTYGWGAMESARRLNARLAGQPWSW